MALAPQNLASASEEKDGGALHVDAPELRLFVMGLFFMFGGITSLNDVIIPKLKELLNYTQAMLVQFCFFTAYLVIGIPGAKLVKKIGYMRGAVAGLLTMMVGCLLFIPASQNAVYGLFLFALFVLAIGLMNAIMFPTIFSLASERLGSRAADGSGIINVAIFGGAVIPLATGALAEVTGSLGLALLLPAACYATIAAFGTYARRPAAV